MTSPDPDDDIQHAVDELLDLLLDTEAFITRCAYDSDCGPLCWDRPNPRPHWHDRATDD